MLQNSQLVDIRRSLTFSLAKEGKGRIVNDEAAGKILLIPSLMMYRDSEYGCQETTCRGINLSRVLHTSEGDAALGMGDVLSNL